MKKVIILMMLAMFFIGCGKQLPVDTDVCVVDAVSIGSDVTPTGLQCDPTPLDDSGF